MGILDRLLGKGRPKADAVRPPKCAANPGQAVQGEIGFSNDEESWTETFHLPRLTAQVLRERGHDVVEHDSWLELRPSGFVVQPALVEMGPLPDGRLKSITTMDVSHPALVPQGLFEYQHAVGESVDAALRSGIENWEALDLRVLLDALRPRPETCTVLEMEFPARDGAPARTRRALLGAVACFAQDEPAPPPPGSDDPGQCERDHPFCSCCFLTRNHDAFRAQLEGDACFGIRFYAMRNEDGTPEADCRINGEDYEPGMASLREYVAGWPGSGFEFRKQYVLIHTR